MEKIVKKKSSTVKIKVKDIPSQLEHKLVNGSANIYDSEYPKVKKVPKASITVNLK